MARRLVLASAALLSALSACLLPDLYPLSGGPAEPGDGGPDATPITDAAKPDAPDVGTSTDGAVRFCDTVGAVAFCDDFDVGTFAAAWESPNVFGAGSTFAPGTLARSAPTSAHATVLGSSSGPVGAAIQKSLPGTLGALDYAYDLYVVKKPTTNGLEVNDMGVSIGPDDWYTGLVLQASGDIGFVEHDKTNEPNQYSPTNLTTSVPIGKWVRIATHLELDPNRGGPSVTMKMDGVTVYSVAVPANYGFVKGPMFVNAGINYADQGTNGGELYVDNVVAQTAN